VTLMLGVPLDNHLPYSAQDLWQAITDNIANDTMFDLGFPKPKAEYLAYGKFYAPEGFAVSAGHVGIQFTDRKKHLTVTGPRSWRKLLTPTTPEPITEVDISYSNAFGGKDYALNPNGRGFDAASGEPLPQLEYTKELISRAGHTPKPASLGATSIDWMPRKKLWGSYGDHWQKYEAPFFASNLNPDFFMQGAPDQWLDRYILGDEHFVLKNMHPAQQTIEGRLPSYRFKLLAQVEDQPDQLLDCQTDTALFLPTSNMVVLIARAEIPIKTFDGAEVSILTATYEDTQQAKRDVLHYKTHTTARLNDQLNDEEIEDYAPLRPDSVSALFLQNKQSLSLLTAPAPSKPLPLAPGTAAISALGLGGILGAAAKAAAKGKSKEGSSASSTSVLSENPLSESSSSAAQASVETFSAEEITRKSEAALEQVKKAFAELNIAPEKLDAILENKNKEDLLSLLKEQFPDLEELTTLEQTAENPDQAILIANNKAQQAQKALEEQIQYQPEGMSNEQHEFLKNTLTGDIRQEDLAAINTEELDKQLDKMIDEVNALYPLLPATDDQPPTPDNIPIDHTPSTK